MLIELWRTEPWLAGRVECVLRLTVLVRRRLVVRRAVDRLAVDRLAVDRLAVDRLAVDRLLRECRTDPRLLREREDRPPRRPRASANPPVKAKITPITTTYFI